MSTPIGRFHVLTDFTLQQRFSHAELAEKALRGGADLIQYREKREGVQHRLRSALEVVARCRELNAPVIIDDHLDVCLASHADGVHLGQRDFPIDVAREVLGQNAIIGATVTNQVQAKKAERAGADYLGFGPVFESGTKRQPASVKGLSRLSAVLEVVEVPVIAISGITPDRVASIMNTGAHGIAVLSGIALADDPEEAAAKYRHELDKALGQL